MPTAAESTRPRQFAIMVIMMNDTCMNPSCKAMGVPICRSLLVMRFFRCPDFDTNFEDALLLF